jgi:multiple sugar transport system substrate-binding protein
MLHLPFGYNVRTLFYRKDLYQQQGLTEPETFEDFLANARKLTDAANGFYGFAMRGARGAFWPIPIWGFGALGTNEFFDDQGNWNLGKPEARRGIQFYANLYITEDVCPPESINWGFNEKVGSFYSEITAMYTNDQPTLNTLLKRMDPEKIGTARVPKGWSGKRFTTAGGMGWGLPLQADESEGHFEARITLMEYLASPETILDWAAGDLKIPPIKGALEERPNLYGDRTEWLEPTLGMVEDSETYSIPLGQPYPENSKFIEEISHQDWQKILGGQATLDEILDKWSVYHETAYEEYRKSLQ